MAARTWSEAFVSSNTSSSEFQCPKMGAKMNISLRALKAT